MMHRTEGLEGIRSLLNIEGVPCRTYVAQWTTRDFNKPVVRWSTVPGVVQNESMGSFSTYTQLQMCGAPANSTGWVNPGALNYAAMTGLQPNTRYYYVVGDQAC
jgi:hypothetical protein